MSNKKKIVVMSSLVVVLAATAVFNFALANASELTSGKYTATPNASAKIKPLEANGNKLLLIEWTADGVTGKNHFVTGKPVYDLNAYKLWLDNLNEFYGTPRTY